MIQIQEITKEDTPYINKDLWIAEVNFKMERPRIIKPTLAKLVSREEAPKNKRIYYSYTFFKPYNEKGKLLNKVIGIFDNTGYRSYSGNPLSVFETKQEAKTWFVEKLSSRIDERIIERDRIIKSYDSTTQEYIDMITEVDGIDYEISSTGD